MEYTGLDRFPTILARVVTDVDSRTMTLKFTIRGPNINYAELRKVMADSSVAVKGVDEITVSKMRTPTKT